MIGTATTPARYRLLETIGRGGMGEVCLADDLMLGRRVALKFLTSQPAENGRALDHLLREARAAAALDHPFICKIYEVTALEHRPCIVMEYVAGETLERRLRRGPFPLAEALRLAEEIAEALEAAHKRRLVHRDLKPANVIVTEGDHIKVMDFGLATELPALADGADDDPAVTTAGEIWIGTPAYMSPEQMRGHRVDGRADIFSFGVLLYELLSGTHPFRCLSVRATLTAILQDPPADLHQRTRTVPQTVAVVVARMLAKDPAGRYQTFSDVRLELRRLSSALAAAPGTRSLVIAPEAGGDRAPLPGRQTEQSELSRRIRQAAAGHGALVLVAGEAGAGKSRLAEEALIEARGLGCLTLVGRCHEQQGTPPLIPYVEVLEEAARLLPASAFRDAVEPTAPELAKLLPELHRLFPDMPFPLELPPELRQRFLFNNVREFLVRCGHVTPLALFLDDLQWADESTLQLTQHLAQHLDKMAVIVIAAYRDVGLAPVEPHPLTDALNRLLRRVRARPREMPTQSHSLTRAVDQLLGRRLAHLISLAPLSEAAVGSMLAALGSKNPPATLVRKFFDETGGNPFFVEELFRYLNEERRLLDDEGHWRRDVELGEIDVPTGVRRVIGRRLERVSPETRNILTAAAAIGRYFELDLLEAVTNTDGDALIVALEEAEQAHLVKGPSGRQERRWRFAHQLICQTLTARLPQRKRQRLHVRLADAMEQVDGGSGRYASDMAHHLYSAGSLADSARTARALISAGDVAYAMYATDEAVTHYRHALELLKDAPVLGTDRLGMEERLADLLALMGNRAGARDHYEDLASLHERAGAAIDRARIIRKMGTLHWQRGDRVQAAACYERALAALEGQTAHLERAHLYQALGLAAFRSGDNQQAVQWAERALASARSALEAPAVVTPEMTRMSTAVIAHATNTIGVALARSGQLDSARERIEQSVAAAREQGLLDVLCRGYANLGVLYGTLEPKRAIEASLTGLELATRIGAVSLQPYIYANLAAAYCALTDRCETEGLLAAQAAADLDRQLGQLDHIAVPLIVMAQIHQCHGDLREAQDAYREALTFAEKVGEPQLLFPCYDGLATIHLDRGDRKLAEQYLQKAKEVCERAGVDPDALLMLPFLC